MYIMSQNYVLDFPFMKYKNIAQKYSEKNKLTSSDMPLTAELAADFFAPSVAARAVLCAPAIKQIH